MMCPIIASSYTESVLSIPQDISGRGDPGMCIVSLSTLFIAKALRGDRFLSIREREERENARRRASSKAAEILALDLKLIRSRIPHNSESRSSSMFILEITSSVAALSALHV
mmetsp:Transcript_20989/g.37906  ORF Transcript_20989/g.37906 Transcript_20989/m.37906 type:complete len:112 (+) Transcript_20989:316-651(+)